MFHKFYVIDYRDVGPNEGRDAVEIATAPGRTNMSREERVEGWLGTTNDVSVTAHGEFETVEAARAFVAENFADYRETDDLDDEDVVAAFREPRTMGASESVDWIRSGMDEITDTATDEDINAFVEMVGRELLDQTDPGEVAKLDKSAVRDFLIRRRDEMAEAVDEEESEDA